MIVRLKREFRAGGNYPRFRAHPEGVEMPDELRDKLPSDAEILEEPEEAPKKRGRE